MLHGKCRRGGADTPQSECHRADLCTLSAEDRCADAMLAGLSADPRQPWGRAFTVRTRKRIGTRAVTLDAFADDEELLDRLADLVADRVAERLAPHLGATSGRPEGLISAREVARMTGMTRRWVYDHAGDLGAVPLGSGSTPRLGFHPARVREYLDQSVADPPPLPVPYYAKPRRRRQPEKTDAVRRLLGELPLYP
jgi:predicted DNA-binding transcriptional regulator AlpA